MGADLLRVPTIAIEALSQPRELVECLLGLGEYDWIVFTSARGVDAFFEAFFKAYKDIRSLGNVRLAAVGPATAARITRSHLEVDAIPDSYQAEEILGAIQKHESLDNLRILLARAEVANPQYSSYSKITEPLSMMSPLIKPWRHRVTPLRKANHSFTPALTGSPLPRILGASFSRAL